MSEGTPGKSEKEAQMWCPLEQLKLQTLLLLGQDLPRGCQVSPCLTLLMHPLLFTHLLAPGSCQSLLGRSGKGQSMAALEPWHPAWSTHSDLNLLLLQRSAHSARASA